MRLFSIVMLAGLGVAGLYGSAPEVGCSICYEGIYPSDPYKREALQVCF